MNMNLQDISTQLLFVTAPIQACKDGKMIRTGTGFVYNASLGEQIVPILFTNRHVVESVDTLTVKMVSAEDGAPKLGFTVDITVDKSAWNFVSDESIDLVGIPLGPALRQINEKGQSVFFKGIPNELFPSDQQLDQLAAVESVLFIGYPSGISDQHNSLPIVRQGMTATPVWNNFGGNAEFLIDAGVYPGSSGSPVFVYNRGMYTTDQGITIGSRIYFLGILTGSYMAKQDATTPSYFLGLGRVIKGSIVKNFASRLITEWQKNKSAESKT